MTVRFTESIVEDAALGWLHAIGFTVLHGPDIAGSRALAALRDTLLPKLVSSDLRVTDADKLVAQAT